MNVINIINYNLYIHINCINVDGQTRVHVKNFEKILELKMKQYVPNLVATLSKPLKRVGVLISGTGTNLQSLIDATQDPSQHIGAEIVLVISNKSRVEGLKRAERAGIKTVVINMLMRVTQLTITIYIYICV